MDKVWPWLRRWGTWGLVGLLLAGLGVVWLMLRAARRQAQAHRLVDETLELGRRADAAYVQGVGQQAGREVEDVAVALHQLAEDHQAALDRQKEERNDPQEMDEQEVADELGRRLALDDPRHSRQ